MKVNSIDDELFGPPNLLYLLFFTNFILFRLPKRTLRRLGFHTKIINIGSWLNIFAPIFSCRDFTIVHCSQNNNLYRMTSNLIRQPDKYELASIVTKNSRTGITSNRRLLIIKGGKLYYYSSVPKNFTGDTKVLELSHQLPKCSIDIMNIKRVNGFDVSSPFFSIEFNAGNMMEKQDIRNSSMNENYNFSPKDTRQQITWQFTCDNQFIKQRWVTSLNHLIQYYKQQNLEMQNFMQNIQNNSSQPEQFKNSSNGSFSSRSSIRMPIPWRESAISRRSYNPDKGFEFKDSSNSPLNLQKIEDLSFLKKNPSDNNIINKSNDDHQFQMIILEEPTRSLYKSRSEDVKIQRSEDHLKKSAVQPGSVSIPLSMIQQPNTTKSTQLSFSSIVSTSNPAPLSPILISITNPSLPITIEQLPEQSIPQTPIKEHSLSYHEEQNYSIDRGSVEKTLADLKIFRQFQQEKIEPPQNSYVKIEKQQSPPKIIQKDSPKLQKQPVPEIQPVPVIQKNPVLEQLHFAQTKYPPLQKQRPVQRKVSLQKNQSIQLQFGSSTSLEPIQINEARSTEVKNQLAYYEQFYPFHYLWGEGLRIETKFNQRIDCQKQMLHQILNFKQRAIQSLADWIQSKAVGQNRYPIIEQNSRFIVLQIGNILLKVASITTQKININGAQKIFYNEDSIKNLKRQFKIHQNLFKTISKRLRSQPSLKIRIPLSVFIQYRGVVCTATRQYANEQSLHSVEEDEWNNERNTLLEEGYKLQSFNYKRVGKYLQISLKTKGKNVDKDQQNFREYLKKIVLIGGKEKHHNFIFDPPIDRKFLEIAAKQNASTSIESLQRYVKGLKLAKHLQGPCPKEQLIQTLQNCIFCKKLRKIYRSAQGEINETHFFNLIFKKQPAIIKLLTQSDCQVPSKIRGQLFSFIEHYFGIILDIDQKVYQQHIEEKDKESKKTKDIFISSTARPIVREYPLQGFQIIESWSKLTSYLQNKHPLGKSALQTKREIFRMSEYLALDQHHELIYDQAFLYYYEADYISCIKKCKQYQKSCPNKYTKLFLIYLLMMKSYSQFSETDFSITLKKAHDLIQFNYGPQNSSLVSLYSLAAFYYQKLSQKPNTNTKRQPSLSQISLRLIKQAQHLCSICFGSTSKQYLDILLDASRLYQITDINISILYFQEVKKLCQDNATLCIPQTILTVLSYEIELNIKRCLIAEAEATLTHALTFLDSKISLKSKIHLYKLQYEVGFCGEKFNHCEAAIQRLWQLGTYEKLQALQLAYKAAFKQSGISECENLIDQQDSVRFQSQQRALVTIQQQKYKNKSLIDTLMNAIQNKDTHFLTLVYYLIRKY